MHQRADLVLAAIDIAEYDKDGAAWGALSRIFAKISAIHTELSDTTMVVGSDRMDADLTFYNYLGFAARTGLAGADDIRDELKQTYPGRRSHNPPAPPTPPGP